MRLDVQNLALAPTSQWTPQTRRTYCELSCLSRSSTPSSSAKDGVTRRPDACVGPCCACRDQHSRQGGAAPMLLVGIAIAVIAFCRSVYDHHSKNAGHSLDDAGRLDPRLRRITARHGGVRGGGCFSTTWTVPERRSAPPRPDLTTPTSPRWEWMPGRPRGVPIRSERPTVSQPARK
jgi:hypothetical protein